MRLMRLEFRISETVMIVPQDIMTQSCMFIQEMGFCTCMGNGCHDLNINTRGIVYVAPLRVVI